MCVLDPPNSEGIRVGPDLAQMGPMNIHPDPLSFDDRNSTLTRKHPICTAGGEYADLATQIVTLIQPAITSNGDPVMRAAVETISRHAAILGQKTQAGADRLFASNLSEDEPGHPKVDVPGCAWLVRRLIRESRDAWRVLLAGYAFVGQLAATMIARLAKLDAEIARQFPHAPEFLGADLDEATG